MSESENLLSSGLHFRTLSEIYAEFGSTKNGLTSDEAKKARSMYGLNNVSSPITAPAWLCCLLPCLLRTKAMEQFHECVPEYAFVMRNRRWLKMDSASIVPGDIIRIESGGENIFNVDYITKILCHLNSSF